MKLKGLHIYYPNSLLKYEVALIFLYLVILILWRQKISFYLSDNVVMILYPCMVGYFVVLSSIFCANSNRECLYKYFRSIPNGYRMYQQMYLSVLIIGIIRVICLTLLTYGVNKIFRSEYELAENHLFLILVFGLNVVIGMSCITRVHFGEFAVAFLYVIVSMILVLMIDHFFEHPTLAILAQFLVGVISGAFFINYHLRKVKKIWRQ